MAFPGKQSRPLVAITSFGVVLLVLLWIGVLHMLENEKRHTLEAAVQRNDNLVVALEQYAIRTIHNADAVLQMVKSEYELKDAALDLPSLLLDRNADRELLDGVSIINEKGELVTSSYRRDSRKRYNFADREHFRYHAEHKNGGLYIGKPLLSRTLDKVMIPFTRRIDKADGSFGGIVSVQIDPTTFTHLYAEADLRPDDIISFVAMDGVTYARRTGARESYGENIRKSPLYRHVARGPVGNYFAADAIRGVPSFFSFRKLQGYDMIATVGTSRADVLAGYYQHRQREFIAAGLMSLLIVLFCLLVGWVLVVRKKNLDRVRQSEVRYRSIFEKSQEAILLASPAGVIMAANPAACRMFKMTEAGLCQGCLWKLKEGYEEGRAYQLDFARTGEGYREESVFVRSNGNRFPGEMTLGHHSNAEGGEQYIIIIRDVTLRKKLAEKRQDEQRRYQRQVTEQVILAQEREREFIGRELHDNVNQVLTTVKLYLEMAAAHAELRDELLPKSIRHVVQSINEIRHLSRELSAPTLGTRSLIDSISALLEMIQSSSGLKISFEHGTYQQALRKEEKLALYRIVQEQFNNIIKHAGATAVEICLGQTGQCTFLKIRDNGRGFDPNQKRHGIGINNMMSRARVFEGTVSIASEPGKGSMVEVRLPLQTAATGEGDPAVLS